jgi:hypothetical protein
MGLNLSISGNAGVASAVVNYTGTASGSVTADASGNYIITGLNNGSYTLTPTLSGYIFVPTSQLVVLSNTNATGINFSLGSPPDILVPLPFSKRTSASVAVFACIGVAAPAPVGAAQFTTNAATIAALQLSYAQLVVEYQILRHQDTANNRADLYAAINNAVTTVSTLNTTLSTLSATGDAGVVLQQMQIVVANALVALKLVQEGENGTPF